MAANDKQMGGEHYRSLGAYQPWDVLKAWLTPEEYRGWLKGNAIVYLAREQQKGGDLDISKACHTLEKLIEVVNERKANSVERINEVDQAREKNAGS